MRVIHISIVFILLLPYLFACEDKECKEALDKATKTQVMAPPQVSDAVDFCKKCVDICGSSGIKECTWDANASRASCECK